MKDAYQELLDHIKKGGPAAVAFSGGTDSALLLYAAREAFEGNTLAISVRTPYMSRREVDEAEALARLWNVPHTIIELDIPENISNNPPDRCYLCKQQLFRTIVEHAGREGFNRVMEGTNGDDLYDHRPGMKALRELNIHSPLLETGLSKETIRSIAREKKIPVWDKPASACLLTRLPHNTMVQEEILRKIEDLEAGIIRQGIRSARVRVHDELLRIEVPGNEIEKLASAGIRDAITALGREAGFRFVTLDLEGYRMGSFNPVKNKQE